MSCQEFLARHAEYLDDVMDPLDAAIWRDHAASCPACARYDRVVRQGVRVWRELPEIEPSRDFVPRLQVKIRTLEEELRAGGRASGTGAILSLAIAGVIAFLAWSPLLRLDESVLPLRQGALADGTDAGAPEAEAPAPPPTARESTGPASAAVQLAAEAADEGLVEEAADPAEAEAASLGPLTPDYEEGAAFIVPASDGAEVWWWSSTRPAALIESPAAFPSARVVDLRLPGPYSPLVVGVPAFRRAALVGRSFDAAGTRD